MQTLWFALAAFALVTYVVLDGFDFGAGALHLVVARTDRERRQVLAAIGPFWDGNEVWLLVTGGVLFVAFPKVLAAGLSGFYLAIMLVLWVLILRGISIEFRSHLDDPMWRAFWDGVFALASTLAPVLLGAAFGNIIRGVPLDDRGWFALSLFESFSPFGPLGTLDWFTVLAGVVALVAIAHHGALFLVWKTDGLVQERSRQVAARLLLVLLPLWALTTSAAMVVAPDLWAAGQSRPLAWIFTVIAAGALAFSVRCRRRWHDGAAFLCSCVFIAGVLAAAAVAMFPSLLRSPHGTAALTVTTASASEASLRAGLWWWPAGALLAILYFVMLLRLHRGKARVADEGY